jgi:hypothetical protein
VGFFGKELEFFAGKPRFFEKSSVFLPGSRVFLEKLGFFEKSSSFFAGSRVF